jgi:hypothetical protein
VYAHDAVGCTILDVVRGMYPALEMPVEVASQTRSGNSERGEFPQVERRRVNWLYDKTAFVCLGCDESLARLRLPGRPHVRREVFILILELRKRWERLEAGESYWEGLL